MDFENYYFVYSSEEEVEEYNGPSIAARDSSLNTSLAFIIKKNII